MRCQQRKVGKQNDAPPILSTSKMANCTETVNTQHIPSKNITMKFLRPLDAYPLLKNTRLYWHILGHSNFRFTHMLVYTGSLLFFTVDGFCPLSLVSCYTP